MKRTSCCIAALLCVLALTAAAQTTRKPASASKAAVNPHKFTASAIQVLEFKPADIPVPAQFEMAMYEETIAKLDKALRFKSVYRDGDKRAAAEPDLVTMKCTIWEFKEGSARKRQVTTVMGATVLHVHVHIENAKGEPLVDKDVSGSVEMMGGENLKATADLANNIADLVNANF